MKVFEHNWLNNLSGNLIEKAQNNRCSYSSSPYINFINLTAINKSRKNVHNVVYNVILKYIEPPRRSKNGCGYKRAVLFQKCVDIKVTNLATFVKIDPPTPR
jgi:hypothetical protein